MALLALLPHPLTSVSPGISTLSGYGKSVVRSRASSPKHVPSESNSTAWRSPDHIRRSGRLSFSRYKVYRALWYNKSSKKTTRLLRIGHMRPFLNVRLFALLKEAPVFAMFVYLRVRILACWFRFGPWENAFLSPHFFSCRRCTCSHFRRNFFIPSGCTEIQIGIWRIHRVNKVRNSGRLWDEIGSPPLIIIIIITLIAVTKVIVILKTSFYIIYLLHEICAVVLEENWGHLNAAR